MNLKKFVEKSQPYKDYELYKKELDRSVGYRCNECIKK